MVLDPTLSGSKSNSASIPNRVDRLFFNPIKRIKIIICLSHGGPIIIQWSKMHESSLVQKNFLYSFNGIFFIF